MTVSLTMTRKDAPMKSVTCPHSATFARLIRESFAALGRAWSQLWFQSMTTMPLEIARMGVGAALLVHYCHGDPLSIRVLGRRWLMPLRLRCNTASRGHSIAVLLFFGALATGSPFTPYSCSAAPPSWSGGGHRGSNGSYWSARSPTTHRNPQLCIRGRHSYLLPAFHPVSRAGRTRNELGPRARRARGQTRKP